MSKVNLKKIQNHLAKAAENQVKIDEHTYFRNTYWFPGSEGEDLGIDIEFVHKNVKLRRFADNDDVNANKHAGFTFTDHTHGRAKLRAAIAAYDKLDSVLKHLPEINEPVKTLEELEDVCI
jgi:hypothetical protein